MAIISYSYYYCYCCCRCWSQLGVIVIISDYWIINENYKEPVVVGIVVWRGSGVHARGCTVFFRFKKWDIKMVATYSWYVLCFVFYLCFDFDSRKFKISTRVCERCNNTDVEFRLDSPNPRWPLRRRWPTCARRIPISRWYLPSVNVSGIVVVLPFLRSKNFKKC